MDDKNTSLAEKKEMLSTLKDLKTILEEDFILNNDKISSELKSACKMYKSDEDKLNEAKQKEILAANEAIVNAENELSEVKLKIIQRNAAKLREDNLISKYEFDFNENLSERQAKELVDFKNNYKENEGKYKEVEAKTGVPAELVAAIHWRESNGDFSTYLHNGENLGHVTTLVPVGIYFGTEEWTEAAVDSLKRENCDEINPKDLNSVLNFAEAYNGLGYRNKGVPSPYVWAGTDKYQSGKYVGDGRYDPNYVDNQPGVALMLKSICK